MDTSEVTGELPAISPTHHTPAVTAVDTPSTSNPSATPAFPSSSETATTLAEGTINEAGPQTSENITSIQEKELNSHQKSCKNDGVFVELKTNVNKLTTSQAELYIQHLQMARKQDQIEVRQDETKKALDEMKKTQSGINEKVEEMEVTKERLERVEELLLNHLSQIEINTVHNNSAHAIDPTISAKKQDVIIIGGDYSDEDIRPLDTVEIYSIAEKKSIMFPRLNNRRSKTASFVYNNNVLVAGGVGVDDAIDTIEALNMKQCPLRWTMFDGNLPAKLRGHAALVYEDKLISIGGFNEDENMISDAIYETALIPPHTSRLLTRMKEPRYEHRAEIVNGKVFILGGSTTESYEDATDGVVVYDLVENNFTPCPSLPKPVFEMSTVIWGDKIIVLGGLDNNCRILDDVIIYETETGQSRWLPSMINKRSGSCAVIMNDVIIVFGGRNDEQGCLNSVETFTIGGDGWKELPGMIEKRWNATAVVKPHI